MKWAVRQLSSGRGWGIYDDAGNLHDMEPTHGLRSHWAALQERRQSLIDMQAALWNNCVTQQFITGDSWKQI